MPASAFALLLMLAATPPIAEPGRMEARQILATDTQSAIVGGALAASPGPESLSGDRHFVITFDTRFKGVDIDDKLRAGFPREMTIILQHDFVVLWTGGDAFTVLLRFDGVEKALTVPYAAVTEFRDPSFGLHLVWEPGADEPRGSPKP